MRPCRGVFLCRWDRAMTVEDCRIVDIPVDFVRSP